MTETREFPVADAAEEKKAKPVLKAQLNHGVLGQTNVRIHAITWVDAPAKWVVVIEFA